MYNSNRFPSIENPWIISLVLVLCSFTCIGSGDAAKSDPYFSIEVKENVDVLDYYPLAIGNKWVYQHEYKSAIHNTGKIITITWISEITVKEHHDIPEGRMIVRTLTIRDVHYDYPEEVDEEDVSWYKNNIPGRQASHYLLKGNYVYRVPGWGWDEESKMLNKKYAGRIGKNAPMFFFPMEKVHAWADRKREEKDYRQGELFEQGKGPAPNPGMYYWIVEGKESIEIPYGKLKDVFRLRYGTLGGPSIVWFKKGIGVVKRKYTHSGSYFESETSLERFNSSSNENE